jgi:hypothetical protein
VCTETVQTVKTVSMETTALGHDAGNSFTAVQSEEDNPGIGLAFTNNLYVLNARAIHNGNTRPP